MEIESSSQELDVIIIEDHKATRQALYANLQHEYEQWNKLHQA
jgi:hypothetical protein